MIDNFLRTRGEITDVVSDYRLFDQVFDASSTSLTRTAMNGGLTKRIVACLDVRADDNNQLVVTKGDQYDVRQDSVEGAQGK